MFSEFIIYKSGKDIKDAAKARLNAFEQNPELIPHDLIPQLEVLSRNPRDTDSYPLTVLQLVMLGM